MATANPPGIERVSRASRHLGMSLGAQHFQRRALRRNRAIATALLVAMAALFISTTLVPQPGFWILLVRATAEAAVIGALADWFAVTAIFRQPLGLPIPHTAIVPKNKDRIGEGLAVFIEHNFLTPEIVKAKLRSIDLARLLADWLSSPATADAVALRLVRVMPHLLAAVDAREFQEFIGASLSRRLAEIELAPLLGRAIAVLTANSFHERLLDRLLDLSRRFLEDREEQLYAAAEAQRRRWWIPKAINRQIAKAIVGGIKELISNVREAGTPSRRSLLQAIERLAVELETSPEYRARVEDAKMRILEDPQAKAWLSSAWGDIAHELLADLGSPTPQMRQTLAAAIHSLGQRLRADPTTRARVNRTIEAMATEVIPWRARLAQFIIEVVRQWDTKTFTERLELVVGRDLQYIRITGTLVGGFVGCLLYLLSTAVD
jgi:uncharacterized membrane-anchored protein YjiN (DUF445 family)